MAATKLMQVAERRIRNSLSSASILDSARVLAADGKEISIRSVAALLECTPMALYRHFADKQQLMLGLLDSVLSEMKFERKYSAWDDQVRHLAKQHLKILQANPWAIPLLFTNPSPGDSANRIGENILALLNEGGFGPKDSVRIFSAILALNYGWAGFTSRNYPGAKEISLATRISNTKPQAREFPITAKSWPNFAAIGNDSDYRTSIASLLAR